MKGYVLIAAMFCLTALGLAAMVAGLNGQVFLTVVGAVITIAGYYFRTK